MNPLPHLRLALGGILLISCLALQAATPTPSLNTSPESELAQLSVLPGFQINLFASETQQVVKPIQIRFDTQGRLWVAGSRTYPQLKPGETPSDDIVVLEDRDGDGVAENSTVFATGLHIPMGIELGQGGVYVGAAHELLFLRDTDGDGKADERQVVLSGFGTGDTHQTINSFTWGPCGELLFSQGLHGFSHIETPWGIERLIQAGVWRWWPRKMKLDPFWNGAMGAHNPFGNVFDRWGQPFVFAGNGHGIYHLTPATIRTDHFLEHPWIWNQGRKFGGADFAENNHWPPENQGEVLSGGYLQNSVERFRITRQGAQYQAERLPPLVQSTNTAFRIVDVRFGPDGALYLCDWYNPVIGHYQTSFRHPDRDKLHGRIWRVTATGRTTLKRTESLPPPDNTAACLDLMGSNHRWTREAARQILQQRPTPEVIQTIRTKLASDSTPLPDHLLTQWLEIGVSHEFLETNLLSRVLTASSPEARAIASRIVGHWSHLDLNPSPRGTETNLLALLAPRCTDDDDLVRLEAIVACSYIPHSSSLEIALRAVDKPLTPALEYALIQCLHALKPHWEKANATNGLSFDGVQSRINWFTRHNQTADAVTHAASRLRRVAEVALDLDTVKALSQTVAEKGGPKDLPALLPIRHFTVGTNYVSTVHAAALRAAAENSHRNHVKPAGDVLPSLQTLLARPEQELHAAALLLIGAWQLDSLFQELASQALNPAQPLSIRLAAIRGLGWSSHSNAAPTLQKLVGANTAPYLRAEAIAQSIRFNPLEATQFATAFWNSQPSQEWVTPLFASFLQRRDGLDLLFQVWKETSPHPQTAAIIQPLLAASGRSHPALASFLQQSVASSPKAENKISSPSADRAPSNWATFALNALRTGNRQRGASLFNHPNLACSRCHSIDGSPGKIGPDLSPLGTAQTPEFIVGAILEPQKEVKEGFMAFEIITTEDLTYQGYLRGQTDQSVTILDHLSSQLVTLPRNQITSQRQIGTLMPQGLVDPLSDEELSDLVAYLANLGRTTPR